MSEVKSAQITISEWKPDHVQHKTVGKAPRWDAELGIVCACGVVLGWPDPENKVTLSQYLKRTAAAQVDAASAPGRTKGAFGTYGGQQVSDPGPQAHRPEPHVPEPEEITGDEPVRSDDDNDPGPSEPKDDGVDWGEPPADEPEPEVLTIEDGDGEDVGTAPIPEGAVPDERGNMIFEGKSYGQPDEAQTESDLPPWEEVDQKPDYDSPPWAAAANLTQEEAADASAEGTAAARELIDNPEVGRDLVPYAGTPIMPGDNEVLDPLSGRLAPLDPTLPYTPQDVELKIVEILRQLENSELFLRQQLARLHQATHNHDFRYNLALAESDQRAADQRKAEAWLATEKERHEMTEAEMLVRALRDSQHNLRAQLSGFQSVARSLAVSMVNALDGRDKPPNRVRADRLPPEPSHWDR